MDPRRLSAGADLLRYASLGIALAGCIVLGLILGLGLKRLFGGIGFVLLGLFLGCAAAFRLLWETLTELQRKQQRKHE